jgi:tRNA(fMet)-specific endonuclease VapC
MRLALDTNRYSDFVRGDSIAVDKVHGATTVFLPFIAVAELRAGFAAGTKTAENEAILTRILSRPRVEVLYPDDATIRHYAALYQQLRRQARPMPTNDLWIAALVVQHNLVLFTRDRHFDHIPQILRI